MDAALGQDRARSRPRPRRTYYHLGFGIEPVTIFNNEPAYRAGYRWAVAGVADGINAPLRGDLYRTVAAAKTGIEAGGSKERPDLDGWQPKRKTHYLLGYRIEPLLPMENPEAYMAGFRWVALGVAQARENESDDVLYSSLTAAKGSIRKKWAAEESARMKGVARASRSPSP